MDTKIIIETIFELVLTLKKSLLQNASGSTFLEISPSKVKALQIPLPPLPEQQAIAKALSNTDAWIESLEKLIAKKCLIKQGSMQQLLTPKEDWEEKKLGEVCEIYTGSKNNQDKVVNGKYPFFVRSQTVERISSFSYDGEAILVPGEGNIGSIFHYIDGKFDFHQRVYKISKFENVVGRYIFWYLKMYFGVYAMQNTVKATVDSLRLPTFLNFDIYTPSIKEQIQIATILSDMDSEIETLEQKLIKARQIKQGMMQELLTGRIRLINSAAIDNVKEAPKGHNEHFNDAVLIGTMASCFGSDKFPMTRFKYTKISYLLKRYKKEQDAGYLKKAAGPYKPQTRYGGAEKIALKNKYVEPKEVDYKGKTYEGFIASDNVKEALKYFNDWYGGDALDWIKQFKFETNDNLELWATVDMAIEDLKQEGKSINVESIKQVIKDNKEWRDKLKRPIFSDINIQKAITKLYTLFT